MNNSNSLKIEIIDDANDPRVSEVAALDAELFGPHKSLSEDEFRTLIRRGGVVLGHVGATKEFISEASLVMSADEAGPSKLERELPLTLGYCDGAAVESNYRGRGLQKELLDLRCQIAKNYGKEGIAASVRQKNIPSIKSMLDSGFVIIADAPEYYGQGTENDRIVLLNCFAIAKELKDFKKDKKLSYNESEYGDHLLFGSESEFSSEIITVDISAGDEIDTSLNENIANLLRSGYIGITVRSLHAPGSINQKNTSLVFIRLSMFPNAIAEKIKMHQKEIQAIVS